VTDETLNPPTGYLHDRLPSYWNEEVAAVTAASVPDPCRTMAEARNEFLARRPFFLTPSVFDSQVVVLEAALGEQSAVDLAGDVKLAAVDAEDAIGVAIAAIWRVSRFRRTEIGLEASEALAVKQSLRKPRFFLGRRPVNGTRRSGG
jgi:hypothetical protein